MCNCDDDNFNTKYVGRLAPTPSGYLHVGHAQTFGIALIRANCFDSVNPGILKLRIEDLDKARCKPMYLTSMLEDLLWFGITWSKYQTLATNETKIINIYDENKTVCEVRNISDVLNLDLSFDSKQSDQIEIYKNAWYHLFTHGFIYPSPQSRKDVETAISAPHDGDEEVIFPVQFRPDYLSLTSTPSNQYFPVDLKNLTEPNRVNWRFKVPDGRAISFTDNKCGYKEYKCGIDFGDFVIWRGSDCIPSYELAVVVDDINNGITEVVRGEDLLLSTARQILLYEALKSSGFLSMKMYNIPQFYHCPLIRDDAGKRLAKRSPTRTIRSLRDEGYTREQIIKEFFHPELQELFLSYFTRI